MLYGRHGFEQRLNSKIMILYSVSVFVEFLLFVISHTLSAVRYQPLVNSALSFRRLRELHNLLYYSCTINYYYYYNYHYCYTNRHEYCSALHNARGPFRPSGNFFLTLHIFISLIAVIVVVVVVVVVVLVGMCLRLIIQLSYVDSYTLPVSVYLRFLNDRIIIINNCHPTTNNSNKIY